MNTKDNLGSRHLSIAVRYDLEAQPTTWYDSIAKADPHELPYMALRYNPRSSVLQRNFVALYLRHLV